MTPQELEELNKKFFGNMNFKFLDNMNMNKILIIFLITFVICLVVIHYSQDKIKGWKNILISFLLAILLTFIYYKFFE
jgi:hypothetical protein